jgi:hypothetical protein
MTSKDADKFIKSLDIFEDKVFYMENISDISENQEMIKTYLEGKLTIEKIDSELVEIVLPKSFKGVPYFTLEIIDSLIVKNSVTFRKVTSTCSIQARNCSLHQSC